VRVVEKEQENNFISSTSIIKEIKFTILFLFLNGSSIISDSIYYLFCTLLFAKMLIDNVCCNL